MGTMLNYLEETRESFAQKPFCSVDSLILSQLAYVYFDGFVPPPEAHSSVALQSLAVDDIIDKMVNGIRVPESNRKLLHLLAESPRFQDLQLSDYVNIIDKEREEQFSAVTFHLGEDIYVAFRGTDSYYIAWKEDFNLAFLCPVPSQASGALYLSRVVKNWTAPQAAGSSGTGKLRVGGHSKGGNIAVYASLFCDPEARRRIHAVYSHDGPGFQEKVLLSPEYEEMRERIEKTIPESSLVGVLLQHQENFRVVKSHSFWIMQHDPFSWVIEKGDFMSAPGLSPTAAFLDNSLNEWISTLSEKQLSEFSDALYQVLLAFGGDTFTTVAPDWRFTLPTVLEGLKNVDPDIKKLLLHTAGSLFALAVKNLSKPKLKEEPGHPLNLSELPGIAQLIPFLKPETGSEKAKP